MPKSRLPDTNASTIGSAGRIVAPVDGEVVAGVGGDFSNVLFAIMYCVTGELPAAHGWRPTDTFSGLRRLRAHDRRARRAASDAAPAAARKRRRDGCSDLSMVIVVSSLSLSVQVTVARYASSRIRLQMCCASAWNSGCARVRVAARPRQRTSSTRLQPPGVRRHHRDAVGEEHRLVDRVGDEDDGAALASRAVLAPDAQQLVLQDEARLRVERGERLVHQQHLGLVGHQPRERDALPHAARQLVRILALGARRARRARS